LPTQYNVAVALEDAQINMDQSSPDYLLQNLTNVYTDPDPRTYPLSSYVYMIEPTGTYPSPETKITTAKRQSIADFEYYSICQGQKEIGPIGYSPLPVNLVEAGFGQIQQLQTADPNISLDQMNIDTCDNPTFVEGQPNTNYLATIAPLPPACDMTSAGPCAAGVTPNGIGATPEQSGTYPGGSSGSSGASSGGSAAEASAPAAGGASAASGTPGASATATTSAGGAATTGNSSTESVPKPTLVSTSLPGYVASSVMANLAPLAVVLLALCLLLPVVIGYRRARARREVET
jgi:hypothetical protein